MYLLVDRQQRVVVLHSEPDPAADYLVDHNTSYGKDVPLPEPFDFDLVTSEL